MKKPVLLISLFILSMIISGWIGWEANSLVSDIHSVIITEGGADLLNEDWGDLYIYTDETNTTTYGTQNMLTAVAKILPGQEIHPPHQHTAEEFMYLVEGNGTWSLNGEEYPAKPGDVMYAKPWDWHGITNTGDVPLKFFVVKWDNKGVPLPELEEK